MRFYLISDNIDTQIGMRLAGIEGVVVHQPEEVISELNRVFTGDSDIGIVLITEQLVTLCPELIYDYKLNRKRPLIVEIPDRHGSSEVSEAIARYVKEAVGITI